MKALGESYAKPLTQIRCRHFQDFFLRPFTLFGCLMETPGSTRVGQRQSLIASGQLCGASMASASPGLSRLPMTRCCFGVWTKMEWSASRCIESHQRSRDRPSRRCCSRSTGTLVFAIQAPVGSIEGVVSPLDHSRRPHRLQCPVRLPIRAPDARPHVPVLHPHQVKEMLASRVQLASLGGVLVPL